MTVYYFDTSALVKHYVPEPGSDWVNEVIGAGYREHAGARNVILLSERTWPEVAAGLAAIERSRRISPPGRSLPTHNTSDHMAPVPNYDATRRA